MEVFKIQRLIAIAGKDGDVNEMKRLQLQLIISYAGRMMAVRRVLTNPGGKTPGVDGIVGNTVEEIEEIVKDLRDLSLYESKPVKRVYIPKSSGNELRPLGIPTMKDRAVQALMYLALIPVAECRADFRSFGFRPIRSVRDVIQYIHFLISHKKYCWVLEADIEKYFDKISHDGIMRNVPLPKHLLFQTLKSGVIIDNVLFESVEGTPQGGIISPTLINYTLDGMEKLMPEGCGLVRYADDFIVVSSRKDILENEVTNLLKGFLDERGLKIKESKTRITHIDDGFDFLGFRIRCYERLLNLNNKSKVLLITPSPNKILTFRKKLKSIVLIYGKSYIAMLISKLNPVLRGWSNYYNSVSSTNTFKSLSHYIGVILWGGVKRKHPKTNVRALFKKYLTRKKGNNFIFKGVDNKGILWKLFQIGGVNITRHSLCKLNNNIFLINEDDLRKVLKKAIPGLSETKRKIGNKQMGLCPVCSVPLLEEYDLEIHHILSRKLGGKNHINNLILLHRICHYKVTYYKNYEYRKELIARGIIRDK